MSKERDLTDEEMFWLYVENREINASYAAKTIPKDRLIDLMDIRARSEKLEAALAVAEDALDYCAKGLNRYGVPHGEASRSKEALTEIQRIKNWGEG